MPANRTNRTNGAGASLSARQVAQELGVSPNTVSDWIKSGRLRAAQPGGPGGKFLVREKEVDRLWNELKRQG